MTSSDSPPPRSAAHALRDVGRVLLAATQLTLVLGCVYTLVSLGGLWAARNGHPYDLEWMEGGMLVHSWRLLNDKPTHGAPTVDWIPYLYPTGYASVVAFIARASELSLSLGRSISLVGTLMAALAMPYITRGAKRGVLPGFVAGVVFLSCFPFSGAFYDLVRLDGLMVGLFAWSIALTLDGRRGTVEAGALLLCTAFLVKHNIALIGFPLAAALWHRDGWREALRFAVWAAIPALCMTLYLEFQTGGTYLTWLLDVPASHAWAPHRMFPGIGRDYGHALPFAGIAAIAVFHTRLGRWWPAAVVAVVAAGVTAFGLEWDGGLPDRPLLTLWSGFVMVYLGLILGLALLTRRIASPSWRVTLGVGLAGTVLLMTLVMRGHVGGFVNVNMPGHWIVAMAAGIALGRPLSAIRTGKGVGMALVAANLILAQLVWGAAWTDHEKLTPTEEDVVIGDSVVAELRGLPEPVLSPFNPWLLVLAGHEEPGWHLIALWDVEHTRGPWPGSRGMIERAMSEGHWTYIVDGTKSVEHEIDVYYGSGSSLVRRRTFRPKSGYVVTPSRLRPRLQ